MPTKPITSGAASTGSQASQRYPDSVYDQHRSPRFPNGRPWWGSREHAANKGQPDGFCTEISPGEYIASLLDANSHPMQTEEDRQLSFASVWSAPWYPPQNGGKNSYYEFNYVRKRVTIRYDRMIADCTTAERAYYRAAAKIAGQKGWPEVRYGVVPDFQITVLLGDPPLSPKVAQAALAGDPWLLGFSEEPNELLARLLGVDVAGSATGSGAEGLVFAPLVLDGPAPLKVNEVLDAPPLDLAAMIAQAVAAALPAALAADRARNAAKMEKARAARKPRAPSVPAGAA